jgi:hypothetical protein
LRHAIVRASAIAVLLGGASLAYAFSTGPPASETGAFPVATKPNETNCSLCHQPDPANSDPNGSVHIVGVPAQYAPGGLYPIQIELNYNWSLNPQPTPVKWGFEITAVSAITGDSAGTWIRPNVPPDSLQIKRILQTSSIFKRRIYLEHTAGDVHVGENQDGQSGPIVWHAIWVAPLADSGKVYFFCAGNAANGDGCSICGGDHIYTTSDSSVGGAPLAVPPPHPGPFITAFDDPYPNPMTQCIKLEFQIAHAGPVDLAVFDLQGRRVRTILHGELETSEYGNFWNGRDDAGKQMKNGVYFIRLVAPGLKQPLSHRVTLAR